MEDEDILLKRNKSKKTLISLVAVFVFLIIIAGAYIQFINFCDGAVKYSIGEVDPRFNLSTSEIKIIAEDASDRWNRTSATESFKYDPN